MAFDRSHHLQSFSTPFFPPLSYPSSLIVMDIDSWLGDEPEAPPAGPACGSGAVHAGDCELLEMIPADRDPLANTMSEAKHMIVGSTTMVGCNPQSCRKRPAPGVSMAKDDAATLRGFVLLLSITSRTTPECSVVSATRCS